MVVMPAYALIPLAGRGALFWLAGVAYLLLTTRSMIENIVQVSYRQRVTPDVLLGRMNATVRFLMWGAIAIGSALSGVLAEGIGLRTALWIGAIGYALAWLPIFFSPLRAMRDLPAAVQPTEDEPSEERN
jgi:predicted MFS family arabinose efflux permease